MKLEPREGEGSPELKRCTLARIREVRGRKEQIYVKSGQPSIPLQCHTLQKAAQPVHVPLHCTVRGIMRLSAPRGLATSCPWHAGTYFFAVESRVALGHPGLDKINMRVVGV